MNCIRCNKEHDGTFGSGKFCSRKCANSRTWTKEDKEKKQKSINDRLFSEGIKWCDYGCRQHAKFRLNAGKYCCSEHYNSCKAVRNKNSLGLKQSYVDGIKKVIFDDDMRRTSSDSKRKRLLKEFEENIVDILSYGSNVKNDTIKKYLVKLEIWKYECIECGIDEWNNKPISLELDHINGDNKDNRLKNLRMLCPNCHSQTPTFRRKKSSLK